LFVYSGIRTQAGVILSPPLLFSESPPPKRCQNALVTLLLPGTLIKRARATPPPGYSTQIAIFLDGDKSKGLVRSVQRTSGLDARIVSLAGAHPN
jgi:hypothetical protein